MTVSHSSQLQGWQVCTGVLGKRNLQPIALHYPALHLTGQGGKGYQLYAELPGPTYPQVGLCLGSVHPQPCVGLGSHTHSCAWARGLGCAPSGGTLRQRRICHTHSDPVGRNSLQRLQWGRDRLRDFKPTVPFLAIITSKLVSFLRSERGLERHSSHLFMGRVRCGPQRPEAAAYLCA